MMFPKNYFLSLEVRPVFLHFPTFEKSNFFCKMVDFDSFQIKKGFEMIFDPEAIANSKRIKAGQTHLIFKMLTR